MTRPLFHYDLNCPWSWIAAERISRTFSDAGAELPEWRPVAGWKLDSSDAPAAGQVEGADLEYLQLAVTRRAAELGLPAPRFPSEWPNGADSELPLLAALYAEAAGRVIAVSLAAFRQQFVAGRSLAELDNVLLAAASCELHPRAMSKGMDSTSVARRLEENTRAAGLLGVTQTPAVTVGEAVFEGEEGMDAAVLANLEACS